MTRQTVYQLCISSSEPSVRPGRWREESICDERNGRTSYAYMSAERFPMLFQSAAVCIDQIATHHQIPECQCLIHLSHEQHLHVVPSTRRSHGQLVLPMRSAFCARQVIQRQSKLLKQVLRCFGVFIVDLLSALV